jgi:hypothetical protein
MDKQERLLDVVILDDLSPQMLEKVVVFFNSEFSPLNSKPMDQEFFKTKFRQVDSLQQGFLTIATYQDKVVGTCSAVRKKIHFQGRTIDAIEIGDTYTSTAFRRDCHFRKLFAGTSDFNDYLNRSVFGRLVSETLDRAAANGANFVYGVPNEQSRVPYVGRLNFELIDADSTHRISSPTPTHPSIQKNLFLQILYKIYYDLTFYLSLYIARKYEVKPAKDFSVLSENTLSSTYANDSEYLQLSASKKWLETRFTKNTDKSYKIFHITNKKSSEVCGFLIYTIQSRKDGFRLLIKSKEFLFAKDLGRLTLPLSRIATYKFFEVENLSMWVDKKLTNRTQQLLFGYISRPIRVEIVAKRLKNDLNRQQEISRFYNFQYGDSDLG